MPDYSAFPVTDGVRTFLSAPDDYDVDFDNPQRQYHVALYAVVGAGSVIAALLMAQRLYTKIALANGLQLEDYSLILSWICSSIVQGVTIWSVGIDSRGVHAWEQPIERFVNFRISVYIGGSVFMPCAAFAKFSLLIFYLRLSPQRWFRYSVIATIGLVAAYSPAIFLALLFACKPVDSSWRVELEGQCIDTTALFIATCVTNILTDVILFLLPIPTVLGLKMPLAQRLGVLAVFSVGLVTVITSVIRAAILPSMSGADQSWVTAHASVWSQLECNLLVICGTIPTLKRFFRHVFPRMLGSSYTNNERTTPRHRGTNTRTYGSGHHRSTYRNTRGYAQFGANETDVELTRWEGEHTPPPNKGVSSTTVIGGENRSKSEDDSSERGIMETKSVVVQRE